MPSRVQPAQAAQKPTICERLSLVRVAAGGNAIAVSDMCSSFGGQAAPRPGSIPRRSPAAPWERGDRIVATAYKKSSNRRLRHFSHSVAWQGIQQEQARREFVCCQSLLGPGAKGLEVERMSN